MKKVLALVLTVVLCMTLAMISWASAEKPAGKAPAKESTVKTKDPVCGMEIDPAKSNVNSTYKGKTYRFCSSHCKADFDKNPAQYVK